MPATKYPPATDDDMSLLAAWRAGERRAGDRLMATYYPLIFRFFQLREELDADDLTNVTFEHLLRSRDSFRGECSLRSFLFVIAFRVLSAHRKLRNKLKVVPFDIEAHGSASDYVEARTLEHETSAQLHDCIVALTPKLQDALRLRFWGDLTETEIQSRLGLRTRVAVAGRLRTAKSHLQQALTHRDLDLKSMM